MEVCNLPFDRQASLRSDMEGEMAEASPVADRRIHRRIVLEAAAAMAAAGPAVLLGGHAEAQPRAGGATALFAYVGAFTTPERKGHGGGINVYRVDPASGAWSHEQLLDMAWYVQSRAVAPPARADRGRTTGRRLGCRRELPCPAQMRCCDW